LSPYAPLPIYIVKRASTSLRAGDRVLAIDDRSPDTLAAAAKSFSGPSPPAGALRYQGEPIGEVRAAPRLPGEALSDADERLIADLLPQLALAAHTARLTEDLQHSRQRTIAALEDERRRLRRDLHDGLGPTLAAVMLNIDTARDR
jgi:signal transduction histidine kinase